MSQAWENMGQKKANKKKLSDTMLGYYKHLYETFDPENVADVPLPIRNKIMALAKVAAKLQTEVVKDRNEGMIYRPRSAVATRLSLQFKNLAHSLAHVRGEKEVSESTYEIIRKIGFDSCPGLNYEVINFINKHKNVTRKAIIDNLKIPGTRVHQILTDLEQLGIIIHDKENNKSGNRGRDTYTYSLCADLTECLETSRAKTNNQVRKDRKPTSVSNNQRSPAKGKQTVKSRS
jgi:ribosomal protein S12